MKGKNKKKGAIIIQPQKTNERNKRHKNKGRAKQTATPAPRRIHFITRTRYKIINKPYNNKQWDFPTPFHDIAHQPFIARQKKLNLWRSHAMGGIKCRAGSKFPTAVYKMRYIREEICNHDGALARPQFTKKYPLNLTKGM